jgi:hypothetical protein
MADNEFSQQLPDKSTAIVRFGVGQNGVSALCPPRNNLREIAKMMHDICRRKLEEKLAEYPGWKEIENKKRVILDLPPIE